MSYLSQSIDARLDAANRALRGALDNPEVLALLAARSFDKKALEAGRALYERAHALSLKLPAERSEQHGATKDLHRLWKELQEGYAEDLAVARAELKQDVRARGRLGLEGVRARSLSAWLAQARRFYSGLEEHKPLKARLEPVGLNKAVLEARMAALEALETARVAQARTRGEAQQRTQERRAAMAELDAWMSRFMALARVALKERPQWLEKLGLTARS